MFRKFLSSTLARPTGGIGMAAVLLLAGAAAGCQDQPRDLVTAPDAASASGSGQYAPGLDPEVRTTPFFLTPGRTQRIWFRLTNNAPTTRSYWFGGAELSGSVDVTGWNPNTSLAPGRSRWVWIEVRARNDVPDGTQRQILFGAHDEAGDAYGVTNTSLDVLVTSSRPRVGFVQADYRVVHAGQDHQEVYPGEIKSLRVKLENPGPGSQTICARWLTDEGYYGQTETPQGQTCLDLAASSSGAVNFAYKVRASATAGATDRQTVVVYSLADPNALTYGYLRTTTTTQPRQQAFRRFYAWTNRWKSTNDIALQVKATDAKSDRVYVEFDTDPIQKKLKFSAVPVDGGGCDSTCLMQFARNNPGRLYVVADEPAQHGISPDDYADFYGRVVTAIRNEDPTARFSPAGIEQWNPKVGAYPSHGTQYAETFLNRYRTRYKEDPPVAEWRFHYLGTTNMTEWRDSVASRAKWAKDHGAPLVLGSFGFPDNPGELLSSEAAGGYMQHNMFPDIKNQGWLNTEATPFGADSALAGWIISAVWYGYDVGDHHRLCCTGAGDLTLEGHKFKEHQY